MPGITNPAEEYFKDGQWAWDPAGAEWLKLIIDPLTNRLVIDHPGDLEVVQPVPNDLRVGNYGWDGVAWRKLPMVWGFSSRYAEDEYMLDTPAGNQTLTFSTVPAGEVWVVQGWTAWSKQANVTALEFYVLSGAGSNRITMLPLGVGYTTKSANVPIILSVDDKISVVFKDCAALDDIYSVAWGYKMKVAE